MMGWDWMGLDQIRQIDTQIDVFIDISRCIYRYMTRQVDAHIHLSPDTSHSLRSCLSAKNHRFGQLIAVDTDRDHCATFGLDNEADENTHTQMHSCMTHTHICNYIYTTLLIYIFVSFNLIRIYIITMYICPYAQLGMQCRDISTGEFARKRLNTSPRNLQTSESMRYSWPPRRRHRL